MIQYNDKHKACDRLHKTAANNCFIIAATSEPFNHLSHVKVASHYSKFCINMLNSGPVPWFDDIIYLTISLAPGPKTVFRHIFFHRSYRAWKG